jgi:hypothetical protein
MFTFNLIFIINKFPSGNIKTAPNLCFADLFSREIERLIYQKLDNVGVCVCVCVCVCVRVCVCMCVCVCVCARMFV